MKLYSKNTQRWAARKNKKRLKRKNKKYVPKNGRLKLESPKLFSIIKNRDSVIRFFNRAIDFVKNKKYIELDFVHISETDAVTVSLLIAIMMDNKKEIGQAFYKYASITIPGRRSKAYEMFNKCDFHTTVTTGNSTHNYFISRIDSKVNQKYTEEIIQFAEESGIRDAKTILNPILVEIFANTNNHATPEDEPEKLRWFLSIVKEREKLCFSVIDLGVGIYNSLKTKTALANIPTKEFDSIRDLYDNEQSRYLSTQIPIGVYSSTKQNFRGKGLREIYTKARASTSCKKFVIITNKAMVNILKIDKIQNDSEGSFGGTIFYWEMER